MSEERKKYSEEFKHNAVKRLINEDQSAVELANELGVEANLLRQWKTRFLNSAKNRELKSESQLTLEEENLILKSKNEKLRNDLNLLKRAFYILLQEKT